MKTIRLSILIFSIFFLSSKSYSLDSVSARYFPLQVGNTWVYHVETFPPLQNPIRVYTITKDTIINNHKYFLYKSDFSQKWLRYDSLKGNLLSYTVSGGCSDYSNDKIMDSLPSSVGNTIVCQDQATFTRECTNISNLSVFNVMRPVKRFEHDGLVLQYLDYSMDIGIIWTASGEPPPANNYEILNGCVINGIVYGDTTLTNINQSSNVVPEYFSLEQNYPNPFNPKTIITYSTPTTQYTRLKVYDAVGKLVAALVNEKLSAGSYEVEFDGSNFSSGIYFYRLEAGDFIETKRMILLK